MIPSKLNNQKSRKRERDEALLRVIEHYNEDCTGIKNEIDY